MKKTFCDFCGEDISRIGANKATIPHVKNAYVGMGGRMNYGICGDIEVDICDECAAKLWTGLLDKPIRIKDELEEF